MKFSCICDNFIGSNKEILLLVFFKYSIKSYSRLFGKQEYEGFVVVRVDLWVIDDFFTVLEVEGEYDVIGDPLFLVL